MDRMNGSGIQGSGWHDLYRLGGAAGLMIAVLLIGEVAVYASLPRTHTAREVFELFRGNRLAGLLLFDLLGMVSYLLFVPTILALYGVLYRTNRAVMAVATVLFFLGVADFFATNTGFPMLDLSNRYAAAATEAERSMLLAAGETMLVLFNENAFLVSYVIVSAAWTMISFVMLRGSVFGRVTAWAGMLAGASGIVAVVLEHLLPPGALWAAIALYFAAIVFLFVWVVLVGRRLLRLGSAAV